MQYDIFDTPQTLNYEALKEQLDSLRRGLFARYNELSKLFIEQQQELEKLKEKVK